MNRDDLQKLSRIRVKEAKVLLDSGYFNGAYYLLGYSVECALKACIAKQVMRYDFPDKQLTTGSYTHNLNHLITTARLRDELDDEIRNDPDFQTNWTIVRDWSEQSRYIHETSEAEARSLYSACTARGKGVLSWIRRYW
ncbi:HEPN domain-containing protein [Desulfobacterales bacterium HSG2]|nr:HEPN domain-containing protein [Desulfobacterales bacterium HSG2]